MVIVRDFAVNACTGSIAAVTIKKVIRAKEILSIDVRIEVCNIVLNIIWMVKVQPGKYLDQEQLKKIASTSKKVAEECPGGQN